MARDCASGAWASSRRPRASRQRASPRRACAFLERHAECHPASGGVPVPSKCLLEPTVSLCNSGARTDQCMGRVREPRLHVSKDPLRQLDVPGIARAADRFRQVGADHLVDRSSLGDGPCLLDQTAGGLEIAGDPSDRRGNHAGDASCLRADGLLCQLLQFVCSKQCLLAPTANRIDAVLRAVRLPHHRMPRHIQTVKDFERLVIGAQIHEDLEAEQRHVQCELSIAVARRVVDGLAENDDARRRPVIEADPYPHVDRVDRDVSPLSGRHREVDRTPEIVHATGVALRQARPAAKSQRPPGRWLAELLRDGHGPIESHDGLDPLWAVELVDAQLGERFHQLGRWLVHLEEGDRSIDALARDNGLAGLPQSVRLGQQRPSLQPPVIAGLERLERLIERGQRLIGPTHLRSLFAEPHENSRTPGVTLARELLGGLEPDQRRSGVEAHCTVTGAHQEVDRLRLRLPCPILLPGGPRQLQRGAPVIGQHVGDVVDAIAELRLQPGCGRGVTSGPRPARQLAVGDVATQDVPEGVFALAGHRALRRRAQEAELREVAPARLRPARDHASPIATSGPSQKTLPTTAASVSRLLRSAGRVSRRAASSA